MRQSAANPSRSGSSLFFRKLQGEFEKMQRGANCNQAKTGPSSMACMGLSLLTEQGDNHCLAGTFRGKRVQNRDSHIRSSDAGILVGSDRAESRRLGHSFNIVELNPRSNVDWRSRRGGCAVKTRSPKPAERSDDRNRSAWLYLDPRSSELPGPRAFSGGVDG